MATKAHCAYCFESLSASFENRQPLKLSQVQELWEEYTQDGSSADAIDGEEEDRTVDDTEEEPAPRPAAISRLMNHATSSTTSSSSSLPSTIQSSSSSASPTGTATPASSKASSRSSFFSKPESHPLFVTWNTTSRSGHRSLRGCIGTFEAQELSEGLRSYALTSAFEDHRFSPIPASELPRLQCCVTLLTNFSAPDKDPMNWTLGKHGLRISFVYHGRRYGATYLPDVAAEQGWTKEETIVSLMRKAGWSGRKDEWRGVQRLEIIRYEGKKVDLDYEEFREWSDWVQEKGVRRKPLN